MLGNTTQSSYLTGCEAHAGIALSQRSAPIEPGVVQTDSIVRFGRCEVRSACREVLVDGRLRPLQPRPFDLLCRRRLKTDPPCRLKSDPGMGPARWLPAVDNSTSLLVLS
jgi:hypothetical protein